MSKPELQSVSPWFQSEAHYVKEKTTFDPLQGQKPMASCIAAIKLCTLSLLLVLWNGGHPQLEMCEESNFLLRSVRPSVGCSLDSICTLESSCGNRAADAPKEKGTRLEIHQENVNISNTCKTLL